MIGKEIIESEPIPSSEVKEIIDGDIKKVITDLDNIL